MRKMKITKREVLIGIICFVFGVLLMLLLWPKRIAQLKSGEEVAVELTNHNLTADDFYSELKGKYVANALLELVDTTVLYEKYEITEEDEVQIKKNADYYFELYESNYNMTKSEFLEKNGFTSEEDFMNYLRLDFLRNKYYEDYIKETITDEDVETYYNDNVFEPFDVEHILVRISEDVTDEIAKEKANEILGKLNQGSLWEDLIKEYSSDIVHESFEINFESHLESSFDKAAKSMNDNSYSTSLVKTSYGYHIIYKKETKDKPSLESIKEDIIDNIMDSKKTQEEFDYQKTLVKMREQAGMSIKDTEIKKAYNEYLEKLN